MSNATKKESGAKALKKLLAALLLTAVTTAAALGAVYADGVGGGGGDYDGSRPVAVAGELLLDDSALSPDYDGKLCARIDSAVGRYYFHGSAAQRVYVGGGVTDLSHTMFGTARELEEIVVDPQNPLYISLDGVLYQKDEFGNPVKLIFYPIGKKDASYQTPDTVTSIGEYAVARQRNLTEITLSGGITDGTNGDGAPTEQPWGMRELAANSFFNSPSITKWTLPASLDTVDPVAFGAGTSILHAVISDGRAFAKHRTRLSGIRVLEMTEGVTELAFADINNMSSSLTKIIIPASLTNIEFVSEGGAYLFASSFMSRLASITVADGNPVYASDGISLWEKSTGTLRASASASVEAYMGTKKLYYKTPDAVTKIAAKSLFLQKAETLEIGRNVTEIEELGIMYIGTPAIKAITVESGNAHFKSYNGVLFSADMTRLIRYPAKLNLANIFSGSATYDNGTHYFAECYIIPKTVKYVDGNAFSEFNFKYIYFPAFDYDETANGATPDYINNNLIRLGESAIRLNPDLLINFYLPAANLDHYLYKHGADNQEVDPQEFSDFSKGTGILRYSSKTGLYTTFPIYWNKQRSYASSLVDGEGDPFYIKYRLYGTPEYVRPAA
ncbi:MAG: leucine-rich repeat domain-containing protein [Clostridiales bacterium]|jgi:hypothetical protein|nr:leucine-rich repeat domain-containing protein [Clostridiales bacterium]